MKTIITLFISFILLSNSSAFGQKVSKDFVDGEVYVRIKNEVSFLFDTLHRKVDIRTKLPFLIPLMNKYNITKVEASFYFSHSNKLKRTFRIHFSKTELVGKLIEEMKKLNQIEYAEKIPLVYRPDISNDQKLNQREGQYALNNNNNYTPNDLGPNQYGLYNIHAQEAWDVSRGNRLVIIAIVNNAIDVNHKDLAKNVVKQWDVADDDSNAAPPLGWQYGDNGTIMAGIACATTNNGKGIASIGFNCGLMAVKTMSDDGNSSADYELEGISWAAENGAKVICCDAYITGDVQTVQDVIDDAYDLSAIVVAPAGIANTNIKYPGACNHVVAVAAVDSLDKKTVISAFGSWVDVSAPGDSIYTTWNGNSYFKAGGSTALAVPFVAGLCGLILSVNPLLSVDDVTSILINTTDNIDAQNPQYIGQLGSGRINAFRAVESALPCNTSINLGTGTFKVPKTESSGTITSKNKIPAGEQVIFDAATKVDLLPGFAARSGCTFRAYIDGCGNQFVFNNNTQESIKADQIMADQKEDHIAVDELVVSSLNVFPNPVRSTLNVNLYGLQTGRYNLVVSNISGNTIKQKAISISQAKSTIQLSVADIPPGMYIIRIAENPGVKSVKFMKE